MKTIILKKGFVKYPDEWVAVKNMIPSECDYCGAVQIRNANKYKCPTFLFFLNKPVGDMNREDEKNVNDAIIKRFPLFERIIDDQVEPIRDENYQLLNLEEWDEAPTIGYFPIPEHDGIGLHVGADIYRNEYGTD